MDSKTYDTCLNKGDISWNDLAKILNYNGNGEKLRSAFRREKEKRLSSASEKMIEYYSNEQVLNESFSINPDGTQTSDRLIEICEADLKSPESIMKAHGFDITKWEVVSCRNNLWHGPIAGGGKQILYQSKLVVRPKKEKELTFEDIDKFFENFQAPIFSPTKAISTKNYSRDGKVLEIDLADLHIGKEELEKGASIAERCRLVIDDIISRIGNTKFSEIILVNLGDLLHYDTFNRTTTSGTAITTNMDLPSMFDEGANILIEAIERLSAIAPVEVIGIFGNHDHVSSYMLIKAIEFYFRGNYNVAIDSGHMPRKYRKFGNNLVYWVHGDLPKANVGTLLQREARKEYGETKFAEIHLGHFHSQQTQEKDGVIVRYLPTIASTDQWHMNQGYTGAVRSTVSFVWDLENGLQEIWFTNL